MNAAVQTIWAELIATTLADAGVALCVVSPGSRSTPLVAALCREPRLELVTIIDERAAAFFALGAARATGTPAALVCTSGTAAAHYLPAIVEASMAGVPLIALTADRPPELHACGASQTIDQSQLYGGFVRCAFDLGAPVASEPALRGLRRKILQSITCALGPDPGPVHLDVPLRKPLEPAVPTSDTERALARFARDACAEPPIVAPPKLAPDRAAIARLATAISAEAHGVIVAGAMPVAFAAARDAVLALAARAGYPIVAEAGSQLRFGPRPDGVVFIDHVDLIPIERLPRPQIIIQLGAEPVAASWPAWLAESHAARWVLAGTTWRDPDSSAHCVILGDVELSIDAILSGLETPLSDARTGSSELRTLSSVARTRSSDSRTLSSASRAWLDGWRAVEQLATSACERALEEHPRSEGAVIRAAVAALPEGAMVQIGNSLPIRVVDQVCSSGPSHPVITQRGAAGIDGLIASAAGATRTGQPILLVLGDVSFAHDLGGLVAARCASAPIAILVIDNRGGQIFAGLPIARAELDDAFERHWLTIPEIDPAAVASALGARAITVASAHGAATAVASALAMRGVTVIHAPVTTSGARDMRAAAIALHDASEPPLAKLGGNHD